MKSNLRTALLGTLLALAAGANAETRLSYSASITVANQTTKVSARLMSLQTGNFDKLVFFLEGFDPYDGTPKQATLDSMENGFLIRRANLKKTLLNLGYDIVLVNFDNNWHAVDQNGLALGKLMQTLWDNSTKAEPIKVYGLSMGGLIGTYAAHFKPYVTSKGIVLPTEVANIVNPWNFRCNLIITHDAPHQGAYIPYAIYAFTHFFKDEKEGGAAKQYYNAISSPAARQMLIMPLAGTTTDHAKWQAAYDPLFLNLHSSSNERSVGIVNGSWNGMKQIPNYGANGYNVIDWHFDPDYCGETWATLESQGRADDKVAHLRIDKCIISSVREDDYEPSGYPNLENRPGGYMNGWSELADGMPGSPTPAYPMFTFVPTFSAAGLSYAVFKGNGDENLDQWEKNNSLQLEKSAWTGLKKIYHINGFNQAHTQMTSQNEGWIMQELERSSTHDKQIFLAIRHNKVDNLQIDHAGNLFIRGFVELPIAAPVMVFKKAGVTHSGLDNGAYCVKNGWQGVESTGPGAGSLVFKYKGAATVAMDPNSKVYIKSRSFELLDGL
jgi:hypothetical protein